MAPELTTQIGVGGIFALLLIREARTLITVFLNSRRDDSGDSTVHHHLRKLGEKLFSIGAKINELYDWHDETDSTGRKIWYGAPIESTLKIINANIAAQTVILQKMDTRLDKIDRDLLELKQPKPKALGVVGG